MKCLVCNERHVEMAAAPVAMCNVCLEQFWRSAEGEHAKLIVASYVRRKLDEKKPGEDPPYVWGHG